MMNKIIATSIALAACIVTLTAQAHEAGDFILRGGVASVMPAGESGKTSAGADAKIEADDNAQLGLTLTYMVNDSIGIGLLAATPFEHSVSSAGTDIADIKHLPPTLTVQYHFSGMDKFNPYVGAGLNYTVFFDEELNNGTNIELKNSLGLALEAGFDFDLGNDIYANAALWYIDIETEVEVGGTTIIDGIDIDPTVAMIGIAKKF